MGWLASIKELLRGSRGQEDPPGSNFTPRAQQVLALARLESDRFNHNYIGTEHVLLGMIKLGQGAAVNVLRGMGIDLETVRMEVEKQTGTGPDQKMTGNAPYTPRVKKVLDSARREAKNLNHTYIGTEHLLLGLLREGDGMAAQVLRNLNVNIKETRQRVLKELDPNYNSDEKVCAPHFAQPKETAKEKVENQQSPQAYDFDFTPRANRVLELARKEADRLNHNYFGTEHLLVGLIELGQGVAANVLVSKGMTLEKVRTEVERQFTRPTQKTSGNIPYNPRLNQVIYHAREEARALNHTYVGTDHLLLGLLHENDGPAVNAFKKFGVDKEALRQEILKVLEPPHG